MIKKIQKAISPTVYAQFIAELKTKIRTSQFKAALSVNTEMIKLYWEIGKDIVEKQEQDGWGAKVIENVVHDLQNEFPGIEGFSITNIARMRVFYRENPILPQAVGELEKTIFFNIPWGHNIVLLESVKNKEDRVWYAQAAIAEGWSRSSLVAAIKGKLHKRRGKAITNFHARLPSPQSQLAQDTLKSPYNFDFLELRADHLERDLEDGLMKSVEKLIHEMGEGFSLVGRQVHLKVSNKDFYLDLLFYHLKLRSFVVVELKATEFKPEYAGKMNFYLSAVDDLMRHSTDNPTIGILICQGKDNYIAEYALRDINKPIGVAEYETKIVSLLPKKLAGILPSVEQIEAELSALPKSLLKKRPMKTANKKKTTKKTNKPKKLKKS